MARLVSCFKNFIRKFSSALYITGDKAQTNFVVLIPHIDFEEQIKNRDDIINNIKARKLGIDLDKVEKRWNFYRMIDDHKQILEFTKAEISTMIIKLKEEPDKNKADIQTLVLHSKLVRDDLRNVKEYSYGIEENAAIAVLGLPNILHPKTPLDSEIVIHEYLEKPHHNSDCHLVIGKSKNLIEYTNPFFCFLKSEAALFEFAICTYFQSIFCDLSYIQFSNADFARSIIVEGCGTNFLDSSRVLTLTEPHNKASDLSKLHLVGGASLEAFMAYFARFSAQPSYFPLKLFANGRKYQPVSSKTDENLFTLSQESAVRSFIALPDDSVVLDETLKSVIGEVVKIYEALNFHFRLVYVPASELDLSESLRLSIQMFSNHAQKYVEVGNISVYDNYLSKRLLFTYSVNKERKFPKIISGNLLSVQKVLACALENKSPLLNDLLKKYL